MARPLLLLPKKPKPKYQNPKIKVQTSESKTQKPKYKNQKPEFGDLKPNHNRLISGNFTAEAALQDLL